VTLVNDKGECTGTLKKLGKAKNLKQCAQRVNNGRGSYFKFAKGKCMSLNFLRCKVKKGAKSSLNGDKRVYAVNMKSACSFGNKGRFPVDLKKCLKKKGCTTCDMVPCGSCQEGCPASDCMNPDGKKVQKNHCAVNNFGKWPTKCLSGKVSMANYEAKPSKAEQKMEKGKISLGSLASKNYGCAKMLLGKKFDGAPVKACISLLNPKTYKNLLTCKKNFSVKRLKQMWARVKKNLKLANMVL